METEKEAWTPQPFRRRQKRQRGKAKRLSRLYYMRNKNKLRMKAKRSRNKLKRNPAWQRHQKKRRKEHARRRRMGSETPSPIRVAQMWLSKMAKKADLSPPLGFQGGPCGLVERIKEELPPNQQPPMIQQVQKGQGVQERRLYSPHKTHGPWKFNLELTPHAQYRMDLRSVTEPEVRATIGEFFKWMNAERSKGNEEPWKKFTSFEKVEYLSRRLHDLFVVFQLDRGGKEVDVITTYRKGEPDPRGSCPSV